MPNYADWIGKSETVDDVATELVAARMAGLLDRPRLAAGDPWPPAWIWALLWPAMRHDEAGPDGHSARGKFLPPIHLPRRMWAGSTVTVDKPLAVGEAVRRTSTIADVAEKTGRSGALVFLTVDHLIEGAGGGLMRESQRIAYREAAPASASDAASSPAVAQRSVADIGFEPQWRRTVTPDPVLLFQYSAVTYNTHRIHYDHPYATGVEGYPGLVVHGPLTATLLTDLFAANLPERQVADFKVTAMRPLYAVAPFEIVGGLDGNAFQLAAVDHSNEIAMRIEGALA